MWPFPPPRCGIHVFLSIFQSPQASELMVGASPASSPSLPSHWHLMSSISLGSFQLLLHTTIGQTAHQYQGPHKCSWNGAAGALSPLYLCIHSVHCFGLVVNLPGFFFKEMLCLINLDMFTSLLFLFRWEEINLLWTKSNGAWQHIALLLHLS